MRPLEGLRVTDFTMHAAGPYCTLMLALLGAEVIRIESRARLDIQRRPHPVYGRMTVPTFDHLAGRKKSITLNLKQPAAVDLAKQLVALSDIVVENYRPGVLERLGLGWSELRAVNPRLVMVSISAYGQEGPKSRYPGYAPIFAAAGGLGYMTGYPDGPPGEIRNNMDHQAGLTAALTVMALLEEREHTGAGAWADLSASEVASMLVGESIMQALVEGAARRVGNDHELWSPHALYPAAGHDRWIAIAVRTDDEWRRLVGVMGNPDWADTGATQEQRRDARSLIDAGIAAWTAQFDAVELAALLQSEGVCAEVSMSARDIDEDAHVNARGSVTTLTHPQHGERRVIQAPWRFEREPAPYDTWSPELGEHNEEVFTGLLGYDRDQLQAWIAEEVVY